MERLLDDVNFVAPQLSGLAATLEPAEANRRLGKLATNEDLSRYLL